MKAIDLKLFFWRTAGLTESYAFDLDVKENICVIQALGKNHEILQLSEEFSPWEVYRHLITTTEDEFEGIDELYYFFEELWEEEINRTERLEFEEECEKQTITVGGV